MTALLEGSESTPVESGVGAIKLPARSRSYRPAEIVSIGFLGVLVCVAIVGPLLPFFSPGEIDVDNALQGPSPAHLFGTDELGRDLLGQMALGARVSLGVASVAVALGLAIGGTTGLIAGYHQRWADAVLGRIVDAVMCVPGLVMPMALVAVFGRGAMQIALALGIGIAPRFFRVTRAAAMEVTAEPYIKAVKAVGVRRRRIICRHVLVNSLPPILVQATLMLGVALLAEAALSFLGLGTQPPATSWGALLQRGNSFLVEAKYLSIVPGLAIALTVLAVNTVGDSLQDRLQRRTSRS